MSWIAVIVPMVGAASLTLGLIYLLLWFQQRTRTDRLMFGLAASSVAALAIFELLMMQARTPERYGDVLRWAQVPVALLHVSLVCFVLLRFRAGKPWLAWSACALRVAALFANFLSGDNLNYTTIFRLDQVDPWNLGVVSMPLGDPNPWLLLGQLGNLLMIALMLDAILTVSRRGDAGQRRRATLVCGSIAVFVLVATVWTAAVVMQLGRGPLTVNVGFFAVLLVMSYELAGEIVRAARTTRQLADSKLKLHATDQALRLATEAADLGLWTWDLDSDESWFTETGSALLGLAPGQHIARETLLACIHPDDHHAIEQARHAAVHNTGEYRCEYRILQPDGQVRWVAARGRVEYSPSAVPTHIRGVVLDITELRRAEERFRMVIDGAATAMLMVDGNGHIALANTRAERIFGYTRAELVGLGIDMLVPEASRAGHADRRAEFASQPRMRPMGYGRQLFARHKDGSEIRVEIGLTPINIANEMFVLASVSDISERYRLEQETALQRDELAHLSRLPLLGEMSGSIAHELNQPLTAILSNAQAALRFLQHERPDLAEVRDSLVHIVENDKRASEVIRRLRAMLRREPLNYQELEINDVVLEVLRLINSDILNRNVAVQLDLAPGLLRVSGDRVQLQQVLMNLVINACDSMEGVEIDRVLTVRTQAASGQAVEISISDNGGGIAEDQLERIFTPFVTTKAEGIGLGLPICRTIIQRHRGTLWASNNAAGGATLHFVLPVAMAASPGLRPC